MLSGLSFHTHSFEADGAPPPPRALRPPERILSAVRQQRFMATPGGLRPADVTAVVNSMAVVRTVLQPVSLGDLLTADGALQLLSKVHAGVAEHRSSMLYGWV